MVKPPVLGTGCRGFDSPPSEEQRHTPQKKSSTHQKKLFINNGGKVNFLIEGDNLAALQLLLKTHKGKIDVIYIDPPYNRGEENDFICDDKKIVKSIEKPQLRYIRDEGEAKAIKKRGISPYVIFIPKHRR